MGRWEPDAVGRLERAALELYGERGFESTAVADIAERAGLTERTFFRHFADKREVLFAGSSSLQDLFENAVTNAPESLAPLDVVGEALQAAAGFFEERRTHARRRQGVIAANPSLQERELIKMASLASAVASALRDRGVADPAALLAAEAGITVFKIGFDAWVGASDDRSFADVMAQTLDQLKAVTSGQSRPDGTVRR